MTGDQGGIAAQLEALTGVISAVSARIDGVADQVDATAAKVELAAADAAETKEIVQAWQAVKTGAKFLKWLGGVVAAIGAIGVTAKLGLTHILGR